MAVWAAVRGEIVWAVVEMSIKCEEKDEKGSRRLCLLVVVEEDNGGDDAAVLVVEADVRSKSFRAYPSLPLFNLQPSQEYRKLPPFDPFAVSCHEKSVHLVMALQFR